jgi:signal transduction histidine kinase
LIIILTVGSVLLLVALATGGRFVAGRAIRPALRALEQQEALLADAAHDLRTPLTTLRTLAETALQDPGQRADLLPRTVTLSVRMGAIVDDLLTRARLAAGVEQLELRPLRLDQLVETLVEEMGADVRLESEPSVVRADPDLLRRAVANLIENAVSHGRPASGGEATVRVRVDVGQVTVADDGPGIDPAAAKKIFDRFQSGSGSSGLGLAISRWIAHAHGGTLVAKPSAKGAIFVLTLPALEDGSTTLRLRRRRWLDRRVRGLGLDRLRLRRRA